MIAAVEDFRIEQVDVLGRLGAGLFVVAGSLRIFRSWRIVRSGRSAGAQCAEACRAGGSPGEPSAAARGALCDSWRRATRREAGPDWSVIAPIPSGAG